MTATKEPLPLSQLARAELELLRKVIAKRQLPTPLTQAGLSSIGKGALFSKLGPLAGAGEQAALALIDLALALGDAPAGIAPAVQAPVLAWTVPDVTMLGGGIRATTAVVLELLASAKQRVVIAGYELNYGSVLFQPLHEAMTKHGVDVSILVDVPPVPGAKMNLDAHVLVHGHQFLSKNWPFGSPLPRVYYWRASCAHQSRSSMHAKCIVVDGKKLLIGSANFTQRGHKRNLEIGVRLDDPVAATAMLTQFELLVAKGELIPMPTITTAPLRPYAAEDDSDVHADVSAVAPQASALADELFVSAEVRPLFEMLIANGAPVPEVGADIEGDSGEVIGSPELSWEVARVAILLPEQESSRKKLEAEGWTCFGTTLDAQTLDALTERLRRVG